MERRMSLKAKLYKFLIDMGRITIIKMQVGNFKATVDGKTVIMDVAPKIENQRTLVPLRFIAEALGATVEWDPKTQGITIVR